ncbi:menaquinone-specific isochorismate synthase [Vibrio zhanjiangensis]|uniref:Isochorismate synthase MenF n=1 Tax=Vibrio zhanjiangensis TaxID=1046128 RepID=A0ABQ6EY27_9VIBR|nr:isochorismate synthase [Vibrio zhanjiangensis]GLT17927.1 menaquinone-specific isochorismate synthase [Vibrio zhanjiangensis]
MSLFHQAITHLIQRVKTARYDQKRLVYHFQTTPVAGCLDWMDAQSLFPKFYWQSRNANEEVVALGQISTFSDSIDIDSLDKEQRVWGGSPFDAECIALQPHFFILPLIELIREGQNWSVAVNLNQNRQDIINRLQALIVDAVPIQSLSSRITGLNHYPDKAEWSQLVNNVLSGIDRHDFKKVVLARKTVLQFTGSVTAAQLLKSSCVANGNSFHFLFAMDDSCSFIGSSPERLYVKNERHLCTEALAGTVGRGESSSKDMALANWLCLDGKNINENSLVVDDIVERLTPYTVHIELDKEPHLLKLRKVQHLKRNVSAYLKHDTSAVDILHALKPTAAVAGLPRKESMAFIQRHESFKRGWYAGALGFIGHRHAEFCVTIRSAVVKKNGIELFSGAGIVAGSVASNEWDELDKKMSTLLSLLDTSAELEVAS